LKGHQLRILVLGEFASATLLVQLLDAGGVGMNGDQCSEDVEGDIDCLPITKVALAGGVVVQGLAVNEFSNEIPITRVSLSCPVDFHNVGVVDLPESGNFSAHGFVTSSVLEQLEC